MEARQPSRGTAFNEHACIVDPCRVETHLTQSSREKVGLFIAQKVRFSVTFCAWGHTLTALCSDQKAAHLALNCARPT